MFRIIGKLTGKSFSAKLKTQLTASFMAMSVIVLLISTGLVYIGSANIIKEQSEKEKYKQLQQLGYNIDALFTEVEKTSFRLITSKDLQNYINGYYASDVERVALINQIYAALSQELNNYAYLDSIFYYGENGLILGATKLRNVFYEDAKKSSFFYQSALYDLVRSDILTFHWYGSYSSDDFSVANVKAVDSVHLISAAHSINSLGKQTATMVVNIDERYFTSIYNNAKLAGPDLIYIMDNHGKVVSDAVSSRLNSQSGIFGEMESQSPYGSFLYQHNRTTNQVIYYKMDKGWIMVDEIPLDQLLGGIFKIRNILAVVFALSIVMALSISIYWIRRITRPLNELTSAMRQMENGLIGNLLPETPRNELGMLGRQFNKMSRSIYMLINDIKSIEKDKRINEIKALQAQINPHFLYNTLNTIKYMAAIRKANNVTESLTVLGNLLRPIFNNPEFLCAIKDEVEYSKNYIKIMNIRYGEGIQVNLGIPEELMDCEVLRFILQPMIENCIEHGIVSRNYIGMIRIAASECDGGINLVVEDNGGGMEEERLVQVRKKLASSAADDDKGEGCIGLTNVNRRIKLHYGEIYGVDIFSENGAGTQVVLRLPKIMRSKY